MIKELVIDYLKEQLMISTRVDSKTIQERTYTMIVDKLPAGCMPEDVATATAELYEKLLVVAMYEETPTRLVTASDFDGLIIDLIKVTFVNGTDIYTIYSEFVNRGYKSICHDDVMRAVCNLVINGDWE
jgi:deoxyxylulose-5-phosphate synthase